MNRILRAGIPVLLLLLCLCGCSAESKVIRAIDAIGTVTVDSLEAIQEAENLYAGLTDEEKAAVNNKDVLDLARAEYERQDSLIRKAASAIDAIGTFVAVDTTPMVLEARRAFDAAKEYDLNGTLAKQEQALLAAEKGLQHLTEQAGLLIGEAEMLRAAGEYETIEELVTPYAIYLEEGTVKSQLCTILVNALCQQAEAHYRQGSLLAAMNALQRCGEFTANSDADSAQRHQQLLEQYQKTLERNTPSNATILDRTYNAGRNTFTVTVGSSDTCVKLELVSDPEKYVIFYVKANETAKVMLLNGTYRIKYTAGPTWYGKEDLFGPDATFLQLEETVEFSGYTTATHVYWHAINCTLHTGYDDTLGAQNITPEEF